MPFTMFAIANPADAIVRSGQAGTREELVETNKRVNRIPPQRGNHQDMSKGCEQWLLWPALAWCHDYAVTKRHVLLDLGWPSSALLLAECLDEDGEGHCVLIADGLVLENLRPDLLSPDDTGYSWTLPIQQGDDPRHWERSP